ncbi:hypothetical protein TPA0910_25200 [Streptomyces hygroscopicus subsp. sporocinereus]|uniref:Uncharacterized protein n=1 Tax=Streptomyces hygroscopicus TaxID=1912 RepID=A0ABQ3TXL4_STRHY|nr:hypothetical protein TPA0910_25200 [Streptomyces hygroscopicus]
MRLARQLTGDLHQPERGVVRLDAEHHDRRPVDARGLSFGHMFRLRPPSPPRTSDAPDARPDTPSDRPGSPVSAARPTMAR